MASNVTAGFIQGARKARLLVEGRRALAATAVLSAVAIGAAAAALAASVPGGEFYVGAGVAVLAAAAVILTRWQTGLYLVAAVLPYEGMLGSGGFFSGIKFLMATVLLATALRLPFDTTLGRTLGRTLKSPLVLVFGAFVMWSLFSVLWAPFRPAAVSRATTFAGDLVLLILAGLLAPGEVRTLWRVFVWSAVISVPVAGLLAVTGVVQLTHDGRFTLGGLNPDVYAPLLLIALWIALVGLRFRPALLKLPLALILLAGAFLTQTRTGLVASVLGGILALCIAPWVAKGYILRWGAMLAVVGLAAVAAVFLLAPGYVGHGLERFETIASLRQTHDMSGRTSLWLGAIQVWRQHLLMGVGVGNYAELSAQYSAYAARWLQVHHVAQAAHNMYLGVLSELGLIGFFLFAWMLVLGLLAAVRAARTEILGGGLLCGLCVYVVAGAALNFSYVKLPYLMFGSLLALNVFPRLRVDMDGFDESA